MKARKDLVSHEQSGDLSKYKDQIKSLAEQIDGDKAVIEKYQKQQTELSANIEDNNNQLDELNNQIQTLKRNTARFENTNEMILMMIKSFKFPTLIVTKLKNC